tara:strand:+ start:506 stop:1696 length:1191 start_codon:yes stop_codon:yes gene_type:complete
MKLTASQVKNAKPKEKPYKLSDGRGMFLHVHPNGRKYWRLKYRFMGKEKLLALGVYSSVSLSLARQLCDEAKVLLRENRDPSLVKQQKKDNLEAEKAATFGAVGMEWFEAKIIDKSESYKARTLRILEKDLFPQVGHLSTHDLSPQELLAALRTIERRTVDIAHRAKQTASQVLRYAIATGRAERDVAADLTGALKSRTVKHAATLLDAGEIGQLLRSIDSYTGTVVVKSALQLSPLLFVRPGELRHMEWEEVDFNAAKWEISASKMKMRQAHIVPLATQSIDVLQHLFPLTGRGRYVFPSARRGGRPLSDNGVRTALQTIGYTKEQITPHGFRAMARTLLDEQLKFRVDYIEHQLSHTVRDPLGRAYNRTKHLPEREEMMQVWANYLESLRVRQL